MHGSNSPSEKLPVLTKSDSLMETELHMISILLLWKKSWIADTSIRLPISFELFLLLSDTLGNNNLRMVEVCFSFWICTKNSNGIYTFIYKYTYPTRLTLWHIFENHDWLVFESITRIRQIVYIYTYIYIYDKFITQHCSFAPWNYVEIKFG